MLSADHLLMKYNMAAQHDLGTGWHTAFCAAEPCWGSELAIIQPFKQERGRGGGEERRRKEIKKDQERRQYCLVDREEKVIEESKKEEGSGEEMTVTLLCEAASAM